MGVWTQAGTRFTLTGSAVRTFYACADLLASSCDLPLRFDDCASGIKWMLFADGLGLNGWEVGFDTVGTGGDLVIRKVTNGTPAAPTANVAHGLTAGVQGVLKVRKVGRSLEVYLNAAPTAILSYEVSSSDSFALYQRYGFVSDVVGTVVTDPQVCSLVPVVADYAEVLAEVTDGNVGLCTDGVVMRLIAAGVFKASGPVSLVEWRGKLYGGDGESVFIIDPVAETVTPWILNSGSHLGQTAPGKSRATRFFRYGSRIGETGDPQDPQNIKWLAIDDPLDGDTGSTRYGRAFLLSEREGRVGSPVVTCHELGNGTLGTFCSDSFWRMLGDPAITAGVLDFARRSSEVGISGPEAFTMVAAGRFVVHTPESGACVLVDGAPVSFSDRTIRKGISFSRDVAASKNVQVRRDAARGRTWFFITEPSGASTHFCYIERVGGFQNGRGGFFPVTLPESMGPTASCVWRGRVILGTRQGEKVEFSESAHSFDGTPIDWRCCLSLMVPGRLDCDIELSSCIVQPGYSSSEITVELYGGQSAEAAFKREQHERRWRTTAKHPGNRITMGARAPALVMVLSGSSGSARASVEQVDVFAVRAGSRSPCKRLPPADPPAPCGPSTGGGDAGSGIGPGAGGPPDGDVCLACSAWMATHTTGMAGGQAAYMLASGFSTVAAGATEAFKYLDTIKNAGICNLDDPATMVMYAVGSLGSTVTGTYSDLLEETADGETWAIYFRCGDQTGDVEEI